MSYFAKIHPLTYKVTNIIEAEQEVIDTFPDVEFWIETSRTIRYNFAKVDGYYNPEDDAFYSEKPHTSWTLNKTTYTWEAPLTKPEGNYYWDEDAYQADNTQGWVVASMSE